jgi:endonuclease YncB( thermonuclease family)
MRVRTGLIVFIALLAVTGAALWLATPPSAPPPPPPAQVAVAPPPPPAPPPAAEAPPPAEPAQPELPPLPEVKLSEHTIHPVPSDPGPPAPGSQGFNNSSRPMAQSDEVAFGARPLASKPTSKQFSGNATATGGVELKVDATPVALFGIKPAGNPDRCGATPDTDCAAAARQALAERLSAGTKISCRVPNPKPGPVVYAICLDSNGVDLSGFLIAQGLALADTGQSYDYVGAESVARSLKRGLWKFR